MRPTSSKPSVPVAVAAIAKTPSGISRAMNPFTRSSARVSTSASAISGSRFGSPIRAAPSTRQKSTTAGTTLSLRDRNGLSGM
jgi:hypothetical protein